MAHKPLDDAAGTSAPPEPPLKPSTGPVFEPGDGVFHCRVPGCSKADRPFKTRKAIAVHMAHMHGLDLEGSPRRPAPRSAPRAAADADLSQVNLRGLLAGTDLAVVSQAAKVLQAAKDNLSGRLSDMDSLKLKATKLDLVIWHVRQVLPE